MPFRDISGHRHLLQLIAGAAARGSLPPSLIFAGPEGVGKRMAAVALAQYLNCPTVTAGTQSKSDPGRGLFAELEPEAATKKSRRPGRASDQPSARSLDSGSLGSEPLGNDACGVCSACMRIGRGVHADVLMIEPGETGAIKVDQVRDAIERAAYRPFEGRRRVVIVDDADAVLVEAQNALLKTLEEPPPASTFVLVTSRPDVLLPTVRSRCQRLRFGRLLPKEIAEVLIQRHRYTEVDASAAASAADGSIGVALAGGSEDVVQARDAAARLLKGVAASRDPRRRLDSAKVLIGTARTGADRDELAGRLRALLSLLRDLGVLLVRADERCLANADLTPVLRSLLTAFDSARTISAFSAVDRALAALERNASPKIVADWLAFQI
jgi:DNA polymerase III subunit delta'